MRIIALSTLSKFWEKHPETKASLNIWINATKAAKWSSPQEILQTFPKAKVLNSERVRFEVAGGNYRLIASFDFKRKIAYTKFIGTHERYDEVDALTVSEY